MGNVCCQQQNKPYQETTSSSAPPRKKWNPSVDVTNPGNYYNQSQDNSPNQRQNQIRRNLAISQQMPQTTTPGLARHGPENYQSIKYLGKGTFGDVVLAEDKESGKQYAMKIIEKKKIKQVNVLQSEVIKKISQCELFVRIRETFQNASKIYIVMQYLPRGDIYYYLKKKACKFQQQIIRILVAQIIIGIETLHKQGIIYRELKPQNILITNEGHIKLGDYGLSRMISEQKNALSTFIGTLQYTAPQAIHGHYGEKADVWAIGVLMYELKFQKNLFEGAQNQTNDKVQQKIESINIQQVMNKCLKDVSYDFRDVLIKLLQTDPQKRISLQDLKKHAFFKGVNWQDIPERRNPSPLKQILQSDHIKFRDPNNYTELAHRKKIQNKQKQFETKLYEFRQQ